MILHPALRYLLRTRWKNRLLTWVRKLKTVGGLAGAALILAAMAGVLLGGSFGEHLTTAERISVFVSILAFVMVMGILGGIGQRGLLFRPADLDFLFPAPIARRHLLVYHFVPHYLAGLFMGVVYLLALGGRLLAHPALFLLGVTLCQITSAHLSALAAELSMLVADHVYGRVRRVVMGLVLLLTIGGLLLVVGGISGVGDITTHLREALDSRAAHVVLFPVVMAVHLGAHPDAAARWFAFFSLVGCALGSFLLVLALRVDIVEASFRASQKAWKRVAQRRQGLHETRVSRSATPSSSGIFRGAGAVFWMNVLTLRRQMRSLLGGLLMVMVMLAVMQGSARGGGRGGGSAETVLMVLAMLPLWMPLPLGFRLPREQLLSLRMLPLAPERLATALIAMPVLVPFALQALATLILAATGSLSPAFAIAMLPAFLAGDVTIVAIESGFVLRRPTPNAVNLLHSMGQILLQLVAVLPALIVAGVLHEFGANLGLALPVASVVQFVVAYVILRHVGVVLQQGHVVTG